MPTLLFILYDDVCNSIFDSQILEPLKKRAAEYAYSRILIISCQKTAPPAHWLQNRHWGPVTLIWIPRIPFVGVLTLWLAARKLKKILDPLDSYEIIARCPLAGITARWAYNATRCTSFTQQARGLLYEEYIAIHKRVDWRARALKKIEQAAYTPPSLTFYHHPWSIESVSPALSNYLITVYSANPSSITLATHDIPALISRDSCALWRSQIRTQLGVSLNTCVYIVNGSIQAWQTPHHALKLIQSHWSYLPQNSHILFLTPTPALIHQFFARYYPLQQYTAITVPHSCIYQYLAAGDYGVVAREPGIVSWVSRPVKALEYTAVHIPIIHNNTVEYLTYLKDP